MSQTHEVLEMSVETTCFMQQNVTLVLSVCYWQPWGQRLQMLSSLTIVPSLLLETKHSLAICGHKTEFGSFASDLYA